MIFLFVHSMSNLHLIAWERVVIDQANLSGIRCGSARGDAVRSLTAATTISIVEIAKDMPATTVLRSVGNLIGIPSDGIDKSHCQIWT